jgi:membrane protease YdiL (CAAX protease family)
MLSPNQNPEDEPKIEPLPLPSHPDLYLVLIITVILMVAVSEFLFKFLGKFNYILAESMVIVPALFYLLMKKLHLKSILRLNSISIKLGLLSLIISLAMVALSDELDRLINLIYPMPDKISDLLSKGLKITTVQDLVFIGLAVVIISAVAEEALFRGFFQRSLEHHRGVTKAVLTSSLVFALVHFNPWWIIQVLLLSMLLGIMAWRSDSILPTAIVHATNNGLGLLSVNVDIDYLPYYTWKGHVSPLVLIISGVILYLGMISFFKLTRHLHEEVVEESTFEYRA